METQEREFVLKYLEENRKRLLDSVQGLSKEQLTFRRSQDEWSIADCLEHIPIVEDIALARIRKALEQPPDPGKQAEVAGKTDRIMRAVPDRSARFQGPESVMPRRNWNDVSELIEAFESSRSWTVQFASETQADLHSHFSPHPILKDLDCYQWLLLTGLHCERHVRQIEEAIAAYRDNRSSENEAPVS